MHSFTTHSSLDRRLRLHITNIASCSKTLHNTMSCVIPGIKVSTRILNITSLKLYLFILAIFIFEVAKYTCGGSIQTNSTTAIISFSHVLNKRREQF